MALSAYNTHSFFSRRLSYQSVEHSCGHFQIRLMGNYGENLTAQAPCTACAPQGRMVTEAFTSRYDANVAARLRNEQDGRPTD